MNGILSGLLLSGVSYLVATAVGAAQPVYAGDEPQPKVEASVLLFSGDGADGAPVVVRSGGGDFSFVTATGDEDGRSDSRSHVVRVRRQADPGAENQGWLGVSISASSDGEGSVVKVSGVVDDSPASEAGLLAGDVLVSVDGASMTGSVTDAVNAIKSRQVGDEVAIVVLRDGEEVALEATLGSRANMRSAAFEVKIDGDVLGEVEDSIVTRGRMLTRDKDGEWVMTELGNLSKLHDLPAHVQMFVPQAGSRVITMDGNSSSRNLHIEIKGDETLSITQADGGDITVTRVDADGYEEVNVYADEDELKANDEDAYEIYSKSSIHNVQFFGDGADFDMEDFDFDFDFDLDDHAFVFKMDGDDFDASAFEWHANMEVGLEGAAEEALEHARVLIERLEDGDGASAVVELENLHPLMGQDHGARAFRFEFGKPKHSFEVRPDGTIEVKIRKGDTEVVQLFTDEDDLADRKPELFEKYRDLMDEK